MRARPAHRGADPGRRARQPGAPVRARLLGAAAPPEGGRARPGGVPERGAARAAVRAPRSRSARAAALPQRRHRRVPAGRRHRRVLLHRGQPAHPGRAHGHRGASPASTWSRRRSASPRARASATPESGVPRAGGDPHQRARPAVPHHHRGPGEQLHPGLRPITAYRSAGRLRHPARRRHRLRRRRHLAVLRLAAGEGHRLGADARGDHRAHAPRAAGVPHPRRGDQPALPRPAHHAPALRAAATTPRASSTRRPELFQCAAASATARRASSRFIGRRHRQRPPGDRAAGREPAHVAPRRRCRRGPLPRAARRARKQMLDELGAEGFAQWMLAQQRVLLTDTTHARRAPVAAGHAHAHARHERDRAVLRAACCRSCSRWSAGAGPPSTSPCASCSEDPWERLALLRERMPNLLLQMLLRSANAVGYTNYPDNVVRYFVAQAADGRRRRVPHLRLAQLGREHARRDRRGAARPASCARRRSATPATCSDPHETKYDLDYYVELARELEAAGTHVLGIKDMAGLCQPRAAYTLVKALKEEVGLPMHFHTHDTSGIAAASVLAAVDAGRRCRRRGDRCHERAHLAAEPRLDRRGAALRRRATPASTPATCARSPRYWEQVRTPVRRLRERHARRRLRGLRARDAGRAVHQPARAGALARARGRALAGGRRAPTPTSTRCSATSSR